MKTSILLAGAASLALLSSAHAEGYYLGTGLVANRYHFDYGPGNATDGSKISGQLFGGYEFTPTWAVETGYADLRRVNFDGSLPTYYHQDENIGSLYLAAKATLPLGERFSAYGKLGIDRNHFREGGGFYSQGSYFADSGTTNKVGPYAALGLEYKLQDNLGLGLELEHLGRGASGIPGGGINTNAAAVNLRYHF